MGTKLEIRQDAWTVGKLFSQRGQINLNPQWQRGPAWKQSRQVLLIDSILRGMDIPKVYLRERNGDAVYSHDAVDGQQRLRAIWEFRSGVLTLDYAERLPDIGNLPIFGLKYDQLDQSLRDRFDNFEVSIGEILNATNDDISALFARLQMGVPLNPAELRNAQLRPLNRIMASIAESHEFFQNSRISPSRSKHLDYLTHGFAVLAHGSNRDIKAPDLQRLIAQFGPNDTDAILELASRAGDVLNVLDDVNKELNFRITQKWIFVDLFWLISQRHDAGAKVDAVKLAASYRHFDQLRTAHNAAPETLIAGGGTTTRLNRHLYDYIVAFKSQGGVKENLKIRNDALRAFCPDIDART